MTTPNFAVRVTKVTQSTQADHTGKIVGVVQVTYYVGEHGPFTENFPKEGYDAMTAKQKLQAIAEQVKQTAS